MEHDLLNIVFLPDEAIEESVEVDGSVIDYAKGPGRRIVSIEVLDASKRTCPIHFHSWTSPLYVVVVRQIRAVNLPDGSCTSPLVKGRLGGGSDFTSTSPPYKEGDSNPLPCPPTPLSHYPVRVYSRSDMLHLPFGS